MRCSTRIAVSHKSYTEQAISLELYRAGRITIDRVRNMLSSVENPTTSQPLAERKKGTVEMKCYRDFVNFAKRKREMKENDHIKLQRRLNNATSNLLLVVRATSDQKYLDRLLVRFAQMLERCMSEPNAAVTRKDLDFFAKQAIIAMREQKKEKRTLENLVEDMEETEEEAEEMESEEAEDEEGAENEDETEEEEEAEETEEEEEILEEIKFSYEPLRDLMSTFPVRYFREPSIYSLE